MIIILMILKTVVNKTGQLKMRCWEYYLFILIHKNKEKVKIFKKLDEEENHR